MSDKHPSPNQILFWTDKRPLAPDVETRISCAIAEAIGTIAAMASFLVFICLIYHFGVWRQDFSGADIKAEISLAMMFVAVALIYAIGNNLAKRTGGRNVLFQSGIPLARTRVSRFIKMMFHATLAVFLLALVYSYVVGQHRGGIFDTYSVEMMVFAAILGLAAGIAAAQERLGWVLDLRAQQGHHLALEADSDDAIREPSSLQVERPTK
ncbi:hypothetical protein [Aquidulcibacter sp.]|uniref:hypothetical protein n=1 Tax=Aquidulcibacter sp. TaxID=2052990 RepID=UPI0025C20512|nr:hypothetical protein [Aquidulcibacter sp.]MCA3694407.1 hypothetical protein [Aquidulcibacter sp.]